MIKYNRKLNIATRGLNKAFPNERTKKQINLVRVATMIIFNKMYRKAKKKLKC